MIYPFLGQQSTGTFGLRNSYCKMYEDAMDALRVKHPEYDEEDDDSLLNDIFGSAQSSGDM